MPVAPRLPCPVPGCPNLQPPGGGRCRELHASGIARDRNRRRAVASPWQSLYSSPAWRRTRKRVLREEPVCPGWPYGSGCGRPTTDVDHVLQFRPDVGGAPLDRSNLRALCHRCHAKKSAAERLERARRSRSA